MARRCARPDCGETASATLTYDYGNSTVWLDRLAEEPHPMAHDLCDHHGDGLGVPRGWQLRDRRVAAVIGTVSPPVTSLAS